jgi:hypothetical protein
MDHIEVAIGDRVELAGKDGHLGRARVGHGTMKVRRCKGK